MNKPFYGAASIPKADRRTTCPIQPILWAMRTSLDLVLTTRTRKKRTATCPSGGIIYVNFSLKKRLEHGSCFQKLSGTPGPGRYNSEEGFVRLCLSRKSKKKWSYRRREKSSKITMTNRILIAPSTFQEPSIWRQGIASDIDRPQEKTSSLLDPSTILMRSLKVRGWTKSTVMV